MCIAIVKPADKDIDKGTLEICADNNPDGCGFAYINVDHKGVRRIKTKKALFFNDFWTKYERAVKQNPESPFLIHFRIKTHGKVDVANCHPFRIDRNHVFIHNGIIHGVDNHETMSDTRVFNQDVLRILPKNWNKNSGVKKLIEDFIGHSKLAVLDIDGNVNIFNQHKGDVVDGVWYSNDSYQYRPPFTSKYSKRTSPLTKTSSQTTVTQTTTGKRNLATIYSRVLSQQTMRCGYTEWSYIPCDCCGKLKAVEDMEAYWSGTSIICFCKECAETQDIWFFFDPEDMISAEGHVDWLNSLGIEDLLEYEMSSEWINPWGEDRDELSIEEELEIREEVRQHQMLLEYDHERYAG
jgi:hypothetical protein